jgi:glycosyltransferase involved in cell wall biosynthesis
MRVAIVKTDYGVIGGFELVLREVGRWLRARGHDVVVVAVRDDQPGLGASRELRRRAPEFVRHVNLVAAFRQLDLADADLVLSTQPPSYAVPHPRQLSLFYHHNRLFYDLADLAGPEGLLHDAALHAELCPVVRALDDECFAGVRAFLVPSRTVADRLRRFNGVERVLPFHAGAAVRPFDSGAGAHAVAAPRRPGARRHILCVSRHEFPKRTELFVDAAQHLDRWPAICVGDGSRLAGLHERARGAVQFVPHAPLHELHELYADAACVVAPAFSEDYGLTALEAMAHGAPVVVCADGGGLTELVADAGAGLVVPPEPQAIADAARRIAGEPDLAEQFGAAGLAASRAFTWDRAFEQLRVAIDQVMS